MKVQKFSIERPNTADNNMPKQQSHPAFKAGGVSAALNASGGFMQWVEDGGFLVSFLIQDFVGMTIPRASAGFLRDKEVTGHYNMQEGFEVLGREGLTGPCMMAVAPLTFAIAAKFGRSTGVNSQLIRRFGDSLKSILSKPEFDKALLKDKAKFKETFFRTNIENMLSDTLGKENVSDDLVSKILKEVSNYDEIPKDVVLEKFRGKSKYRNERMANIAKYINEVKYNTSSDLEMLDKVKVGAGKDSKAFSIKDTIDAMVKYSNDAISLNKNLEKLDEAAAEDFKNSSIAKRMIANISTMAATLGVLSVLPKLYIRNSVSPGARTAMHMKAAKQQANIEVDNKQEETVENKGEIAFKGKTGKPSALGKFGKFISKHSNEKYSSEFEYNGHNFTNTLMAGLSVFGLLIPRGLKAYSRAQVDENGKRDWTEIYEIILRDLTSSLAVVFAVPMLTRMCVSSYENKSGFVLMDKPDRKMSKIRQFFDAIHPYSKSHVLTNSEINSLYNNIDTADKMINFCKYIDKNGGDLQKIISKSENVESVFNDKTIKLSELENLTKSEKNKKITEFFEKLVSDNSKDKESLNEMVEKLMKGAGGKKGNKIASFARGLNSVPGVLATVLISPAILGWFIPRMTYANTRRIHAKAEKEKELKAQSKINTDA